MYVALAKIHLPLTDEAGNVSGEGGVIKGAGESISLDELVDAGQGPENIEQLIASGAMVTQEAWDAMQAPTETDVEEVAEDAAEDES